MDLFDALFLQNPLQVWITALVTAGVITLVLLLVRRLILSRQKAVDSTPIGISHLVFRLVSRTHFVFLLAVALNIGALQLSLPDDVSAGLLTGSMVVIFVQLGLWRIAGINYYVARYVQERAEKDAAGATTMSAIGMVAKGVLWVLVSLLILENLRVEVTTLIAGLGISGIAVALAV